MEEKYHQLVRDGFCVVEQIVAPELLERLRATTDQICQTQDTERQNRFRSQGSMFTTMSDPIFVDLITLPQPLLALRSMGFKDPTFTDGYIISKPAHSPALFWHYDWFAWDDPTVYLPRPQQVFLMYYLVDTTIENGCLRVIPGSHLHHNELHDNLNNPHSEEISTATHLERTEFSIRPDEIDVPVKAGDLVIGDARLLHASHANCSDQRRTVITLWFQPEFSQLPDRVKAQMVAKTQPLPDDWSESDKARLSPLFPEYNGSAQPYGRILYKQNPKTKQNR